MYTKLITHKTVVIMQWGLNYTNNIHIHVHVVHHIIRRREGEEKTIHNNLMYTVVSSVYIEVGRHMCIYVHNTTVCVYTYMCGGT